MARIETGQQLLPSLVDRLIDDDPGRPDPSSKSRGQTLRELRESVRRNLEDLLNTRRRCMPLPAGLDDLQISLVNYGIPDFTGVDLGSSGRREEFRAAVETAIRNFEPRFVTVSVTLRDDTADQSDRMIHFRIDAFMYADPAPELVTFNSALDAASRVVAVTSEA